MCDCLQNGPFNLRCHHVKLAHLIGETSKTKHGDNNTKLNFPRIKTRAHVFRSTRRGLCVSKQTQKPTKPFLLDMQTDNMCARIANPNKSAEKIFNKMNAHKRITLHTTHRHVSNVLGVYLDKQTECTFTTKAIPLSRLPNKLSKSKCVLVCSRKYASAPIRPRPHVVLHAANRLSASITRRHCPANHLAHM